EADSYNTFAKKLKLMGDVVPENNISQYRIFNFITLFAAISQQKFYGLMNLPLFVAQHTYDVIVKNIHMATKSVCELLLRKAVKEERGKVLDIVIKSLYSKMCEYWNKKQDTAEYLQWKTEHETNCSANYKGSAGKIEVDAIKGIFLRSYIGDGDSKTYTGIFNSAPATYLHYSSTDKQPRHINCPTGSDSWCSWQRANANSQLDTFTHDYKSLREDVLDAIKPTLKKISDHFSQCIYENLSQSNLLERCVGGFTWNNNESLHNVVWKIAPKTMYNSAITVELATYIATCIFNEGARALLKFFKQCKCR
ncbi:hypothetical protein ALC60_12341, partial [Trachymyrmex zeteki]